MSHIPAFVSGFMLMLSLILAIGAQNAFVLRQGVRNEHIFAVCLVCALSDCLLILAGVYGIDTLTDVIPSLIPFLTIGGSAYLFFYGFQSLVSAWRTQKSLVVSDTNHCAAPLARVLIQCLALTWLNPHVYLDTVILTGSVAASWLEERGWFALGACLGSALFFFCLGYGSRVLGPVLSRPKIWQGLEVGIGLTMIGLAIGLALSFKGL